MLCHLHSHWIIQFGTAVAFLLGASSAFAIDGPSFNCSQGVRNSLAAILCTNPEAAQADWDLSTAYWASFADTQDEKRFSESVYQRCALPRIETEQQRTVPMSTPQAVTEHHVRCVITAFNNRAAVLRGRLKGDALTESTLTPNRHFDIQVALARKGFLQQRVRGYIATPDGLFGPNTRAALKAFQRSIGADETGFLSSEQLVALLDNGASGPPAAAEAKAPQPTSMAIISGGSAQTASISHVGQFDICWHALNGGRSAWDANPSFSEYVAEAKRRGLTVDVCRQLLIPKPVATPIAPSQQTSMSHINQVVVCRSALNSDRSAWDQNPRFSEDVAEAKRRDLTVEACRQLLNTESVGTPNAASSASSQQSALVESNSPDTGPLILLLVIGAAIVIGYRLYLSHLGGRERAKITREHAQNVRMQKLRTAVQTIESEFPFIFCSPLANYLNVLCMDRKGERLRFVDFDLDIVVPTHDLTVPVSTIVSVELSGGDEVVTDYETTSTKPNVLAGALLGDLLFGRAGAIVGAIAADSEATTVAKQRVVNKPSVLVFELSDLAKPVVRFSSTDHSQCELWLHRVRSAMAQQKGHTVTEGGSPSGRVPTREPANEGQTTTQLRVIGG